MQSASVFLRGLALLVATASASLLPRDDPCGAGADNCTKALLTHLISAVPFCQAFAKLTAEQSLKTQADLCPNPTFFAYPEYAYSCFDSLDNFSAQLQKACACIIKPGQGAAPAPAANDGAAPAIVTEIVYVTSTLSAYTTTLTSDHKRVTSTRYLTLTETRTITVTVCLTDCSVVPLTTVGANGSPSDPRNGDVPNAPVLPLTTLPSSNSSALLGSGVRSGAMPGATGSGALSSASGSPNLSGPGRAGLGATGTAMSVASDVPASGSIGRPSLVLGGREGGALSAGDNIASTRVPIEPVSSSSVDDLPIVSDANPDPEPTYPVSTADPVTLPDTPASTGLSDPLQTASIDSPVSASNNSLRARYNSPLPVRRWF